MVRERGSPLEDVAMAMVRNFIIVLLGAALGSILVLLIGPNHRAEVSPAAASVPAEGRVDPGVAAPAASRVAELERKVNALQRTAVEPGASAKRAGEQPPLTREEAIAASRAQRKQRLERHATSAVDSAWSQQTQTQITAAVAQLGRTLPVSLVSLDCRSSSCVATLEWPQADEARKHGASMASAEYGPNCAQSFFASGDAQEKPFRTTLLLENCRR
jgi:hypothetical protein